jgi:hypothetical protein
VGFFEVRVEDSSGKAIRGVEVVAVRASDWQVWESMSAGVSVMDWPVEKGQGRDYERVKTKTNSKGIARLTEFCRGHWLVASKRGRKRGSPELLACGRLPMRAVAGGAPEVLVLAEPQPLQVRVLGAGGSPVVGVNLEVGKPGAGGELVGSGVHELRTDKLGVAVLPGASVYLPGLLGAKGLVKPKTVAPIDAVAFDPETVTDGVLEVTVPEGRDVCVRLLHVDGETPFEGSASLILWSMDASGESLSGYEFCTDGQHVFHCIPLGRTIGIRAHTEFGDLTAEASCSLDELGSDPFQLDLVIPDPSWVFSGRLVDRRGRAIASQRVLVGFGMLGSGLETDSKGKFRVAFGSEWGVPGDEMGPVWFGSEGNVGASQSLGADVLDGHVDLGKICLEEPDVIVAGVVRRDDGEPLAGARVRLYRTRKRGRVLVSMPLSTVTTDSAGQFEIKMLDPGGGTYLTVSHDEYVSSVVKTPFEVGNMKYALELTSPGALEGQIALEPGARVFVAVARTGDGWDTGFDSWTNRHDGIYGSAYQGDRTQPGTAYGATDQGFFRLERLPAGTYDLGIFEYGARTPLVEVQGLVVPPRKDCKDSRLKRIELQP